MGLLTAIGLRRNNDWEPPTLLDSLLISPLYLIITIIYRIALFLRGRPFVPPRDKPAIRIVCISDTHDHTNVAIPNGDLLIHAGDLTNAGTADDIQAQLDWLAAQPHPHKIVVCGNHDSYFDPSARLTEDRGRTLDFKGIHYLVRDSVTLEFKGGRHLKIFGAPDIPACGGSEMAFQYDRASPPWTNTIPIDTDILITHAPPVSHPTSHSQPKVFPNASQKNHLDLGLGCPGLLEEVWRVRPKLHVFGHVHWGHGREAVHFDECQRAYEALLSKRPRGLIRDFFPHSGWIKALRVVGYAVHGVVWKWVMVGPGGNNSSLMVNAAQMYGNTGRLGNPVEVVDL
ncbi:putative calcineurin-like phosphoesterase [Colletotrichum sublineola]|uniref:Putative calcineurin-like phosphoesterase n=1 Tax=Colletotrichum sublineola TaxID=1173701 RepID=A0A066WX00_COLSU|nr:putative calcineurin-like phosphoesterase [Colletotrichum sublineola]